MGIETSEMVADLFAALAAFQGTVAAPKKDAVNPHFKSKFADLAEVMATAKAPLAANGLALVQMPHGECDGVVRIVTMVTHKSGQWMRSTLDMPVAQKTPQGVGSAITYGRRYAAMAALGMAADDDDGETATRPTQPEKPAAKAKAAPKPAEPAIDPEAARMLHNHRMVRWASAQGIPDPNSLLESLDDMGLVSPPVSCPRFSDKAKKYQGELYTEVPAGYLREVIFNAAKFEEAEYPRRCWVSYLVTRRDLAKAGGAQ